LPEPTPQPHFRPSRPLLAGVGVLVLAIIAVVVVLSSSGSSSPPVRPLAPPVIRKGPQSIYTAGSPLKTNTMATLDQLERLGVNRVRLFLTWNGIAPNPASIHPPPTFSATDPASYPASNWAIYDTIIKDTVARGMGLDVVLGPPPPRWAEGKGAPAPAIHSYWRPSAGAFEEFVKAVGLRYSGHYTPPGATKPLPKVSFWSLWNEPNSGVQLAPQAIHHSTVEVAPQLYRKLADAAWNGLKATGHGHDITLLGEVAPAGATFAGAPGNFAVMAPLRFLRALYCVDASYRPLRASAATVRGCPATAAGTARFEAQNPVLFHASAFAVHPYPQGLAPDVPTPDEPDFAELAAMPKLISVLDGLQRAYGSNTKLPVYSTEFGYQTTPPDTQGGTVSPALAATYINWSEYLTWRNPRLASYDQYLLTDPVLPGDRPYTGFATGLYFPNGTAKPGLAAYRMPLYLPVTSTASGHPLEVWGCARPVSFVRRHSHAAQSVQIQFQPSSGGAFSTVKTVPLTDPSGYFDIRETFSGSGSVRLMWRYPGGPEIFSRIVSVTVG
jgi:hypothetical protein